MTTLEPRHPEFLSNSNQRELRRTRRGLNGAVPVLWTGPVADPRERFCFVWPHRDALGQRAWRRHQPRAPRF